MTMYHNRDIGPTFLEALKDMPVVALTGMRQTGKTTFLRNHPGLEGRRYISFDDFAQLEAAKSDPDGFVASGEKLTIDEAHKCPEIFTAIKKAVDQKRVPGQFVISGSANFLLLKNISESLAGRSVYFALHPFSRREIRKETRSTPFIRRFFEGESVAEGRSAEPIGPKEIFKGGMPPVCLEEGANPFIWFKGFEQTYLERDVRDISQIENLMALRGLLRLASLRTGQLLVLSQLGRDAKLTVPTASRYISLLETSFVLYRLYPFLRNRASRLIKSPKLFVSDSGLAAYLAGLDFGERMAPSDPRYGPLLETYVAGNLRAIVDSTWPQAQLLFWSVQGRHEVDFVIEAGPSCLAIEVKAAARWGERDLAGLKAFLAATPGCKAAILAYNGNQAVSLGEKIWAIPLSLLLS